VPESEFRKVISRENISLKTCGSRSEDFPFQPNGPQNVDWLGTLRANEPVDHFFRLCRFLARQHVLELASRAHDWRFNHRIRPLSRRRGEHQHDHHRYHEARE